MDSPSTTCLPLPVVREDEQGVRSKAHRQKKAFSFCFPAPHPKSWWNLTSQRAEAQRGSLIVLLPGGMAHAGLTVGFNHPSVLLTLKLPTWCGSLLKSLSRAWNVEVLRTSSQFKIVTVRIAAAFYVPLGARCSAKSCIVHKPGGRFSHLPILQVGRLRAVHRPYSQREAKLDYLNPSSASEPVLLSFMLWCFKEGCIWSDHGVFGGGALTCLCLGFLHCRIGPLAPLRCRIVGRPL